MATRIQLRHDSSANWISVNPTLAQGEIGIETDTLKQKTGDGITNWVGLGYSSMPSNNANLTGNPTAPTPSLSDNDTSIATTAFVKGVAGNKYTFDTIADAQAYIGFVEGDVIEVLGYYEKGDGGGHKRKKNPLGSLYEWEILEDEINPLFFGAKFDGVNDDISPINESILYTYINKINTTVQDEQYQNTIKFPNGLETYISYSIIICSGMLLDINGCKIKGNRATAGIENYFPELPSLIVSGYYDNNTKTIIKHNLETVSSTITRIIGTEIKNGTLANANRGFDVANMQENCKITNMKYANLSMIGRFKSCFYLQFDTAVNRDCGLKNMQELYYLYGNDCNAIKFNHVNIPLAETIGIKINTVTLLDFTITGACSFEEGRAEGSIGILFENGYGTGVTIEQTYFEGVHKGITFSESGNSALYGANFLGNYFSSCDYAMLAIGNRLRVSNWLGNFNPDDTEVNGRNKLDVSVGDNELYIQTQGKTGENLVPHLANFYPSEHSNFLAPSSFKLDGEIKAKALMNGVANKNRLIEIPWEGRSQITHQNKPLYCTMALTQTTVVMTTNIDYDAHNFLIYTYTIADQSAVRNLYGRVRGSTVIRDDAESATLSISEVNGKVVVTINGINAGEILLANISGYIRHI